MANESIVTQKLAAGRPLKICAPMVRYSSLPFRHLVKLYGCDLTFTHMILSDCFSKVRYEPVLIG